MKAYINGGSQVYTELADMILLPIKVHFKKKSMVHILSFKDISSIKGVRMTMDLAEEMGIPVKLPNEDLYKFEQYENSLYFFGTDLVKNSNTSNKILKDYTVVQAVKETKSILLQIKLKEQMHHEIILTLFFLQEYPP